MAPRKNPRYPCIQGCKWLQVIPTLFTTYVCKLHNRNLNMVPMAGRPERICKGIWDSEEFNLTGNEFEL